MVCWGRRKTERWRLSLKTIPLTENARPFLLWVEVSFPGQYWGLFFMSKDILGTFSVTLRASLGLAQLILFHHPLVSRFIKFLVKAPSGGNVRFTRVRLRHNNRNLSIVLRFIGSFHFLWTSWLMGIFFGSAKAEIPKWKFLIMRCTNHIGMISKY